MAQIQLKVPPDRMELIIASLGRDLMYTVPDTSAVQVAETKTWLEYRLNKYLARHPRDTAE